jgi:hypothetical protein
MASPFPGTSIDSFATLTDGVSTVLASHQNDRAAAIVAAQTKLGVDADTRSASSVEGRLKDLDAAFTVSATAPSSPQTGDRWIDTSGTSPMLNYWDGAAWVGVGDTRTFDGGTFDMDVASDGLLDITDAWQMVVTGTTVVTQMNQPLDPAGFVRPVTLIFDTVGGGIDWASTNSLLDAPFVCRYGDESITVEYDGNAGAWRELARNERAGRPSLVAVASDQARAATTTLSTITGPANTARSRATALATAAALAGNTNTVFEVRIRGTITVNAAGAILVQAAQNSASGTTTIRRGSTFHVWPVL